eukprot:TRINITY_DN4988_c0_g1_i1.p1 TRINITY_DN4988_c0_g1~~TRINITY_DN4988_c0_g1_i1.p1  ORF type:complete len:322 (+),score=75.05 TRINITY_DN4988_c0_g1_i1:56-1021(+)
MTTAKFASLANDIAKSLSAHRNTITQLTKHFKLSYEPCLVAVGKTHPAEVLKYAYDAGQRHFGENYAAELIDKAEVLPRDIKWHFIGHLQSNKVKPLLKISNLHVVESVDSTKLATQLDKACLTLNRQLKVMVQVNTSEEKSKFGVEPNECLPLVRHVVASCSRLEFIGLMTIGRYDPTPQPKCYQALKSCRELVCKELKLKEEAVGLSMGMSHDYSLAVEYGATIVRLGTCIFGERDYSKAKNKPPWYNEQKAKELVQPATSTSSSSSAFTISSSSFSSMSSSSAVLSSSASVSSSSSSSSTDSSSATPSVSLSSSSGQS